MILYVVIRLEERRKKMLKIGDEFVENLVDAFGIAERVLLNGAYVVNSSKRFSDIISQEIDQVDSRGKKLFEDYQLVEDQTYFIDKDIFRLTIWRNAITIEIDMNIRSGGISGRIY